MHIHIQTFIIVTDGNNEIYFFYRIERSRTIIPSMVKASEVCCRDSNSVINWGYFYDLFFSRQNLKLVHIVCHDKNEHKTAVCDAKKIIIRVIIRLLLVFPFFHRDLLPASIFDLRTRRMSSSKDKPLMQGKNTPIVCSIKDRNESSRGRIESNFVYFHSAKKFSCKTSSFPLVKEFRGKTLICGEGKN